FQIRILGLITKKTTLPSIYLGLEFELIVIFGLKRLIVKETFMLIIGLQALEKCFFFLRLHILFFWLGLLEYWANGFTAALQDFDDAQPTQVVPADAILTAYGRLDFVKIRKEKKIFKIDLKLIFNYKEFTLGVAQHMIFLLLVLNAVQIMAKTQDSRNNPLANVNELYCLYMPKALLLEPFFTLGRIVYRSRELEKFLFGTRKLLLSIGKILPN
ncbi:hypothetical protein ACJX0J_037636, partial [Zea mays]